MATTRKTTAGKGKKSVSKKSSKSTKSRTGAKKSHKAKKSVKKSMAGARNDATAEIPVYADQTNGPSLFKRPVFYAPPRARGDAANPRRIGARFAEPYHVGTLKETP